LISYRVEGRALGVSSRAGAPVSLVDVGAVASKLTIWRTGFRYDRNDVVGFGTGRLEAGPVYYGACVSFLTLNDHFLSSPDDQLPMVADFKNSMPCDTEGFLLLDEHGHESEKPVQYGDVVILRRMNGQYLNCTPTSMPAFRSTTCSADEKFRIWF